jgi:hypothetical protein
MTPEEYAQLGADVHATILATIKTVVRPEEGAKGLVLDRDPVHLDDAQWLAALKSDDDLDENGDKRTHAWVVRFGGSVDPESSTVRSIEPRWVFDVQVFLTHDFGTDEGDNPYNSEKAIRDEVLKVQKALASPPRMPGLGGYADLSIRVRLARLGGEIVHRGQGEISVPLTPILRG